MLHLTTRFFSAFIAILASATILLNASNAVAQSNRMPSVGMASGIVVAGNKTSGIIVSKVRLAEPANLIMLIGTGTNRQGSELTAGIRTYIRNIQGSIPLNTSPTSQETTAAYTVLSSLGYPSGTRLVVQVVGMTVSGNGIYSKALSLKVP